MTRDEELLLIEQFAAKHGVTKLPTITDPIAFYLDKKLYTTSPIPGEGMRNEIKKFKYGRGPNKKSKTERKNRKIYYATVGYSETYTETKKIRKLLKGDT